MSILHVVFMVGGASYVLPAAEVLQMESFDGATPVPGARPYVLGIIHVRGRVVPVVDLRVRLGLPPQAATLDSRVVVVTRDGRTVGLLADTAREVVKLAPEQLRDPPIMMMNDGAEGFVQKVAHVDKRLLMLLDAAKIMGSDEVDGRPARLVAPSPSAPAVAASTEPRRRAEKLMIEGKEEYVHGNER